MNTYENAVIELLSQEENFRLALEIAEHIEAVKASLHVAFWTRCHDALHRRLKASKWRESWRGLMDPPDKLPRDHHGVSLVPLDVTSDNLRVVYCLTHETLSKFYFYHRFRLNDADRLPDLQLEELDEMRDALRLDGFKVTKSSVGWKGIQTYPDPKPFLFDLASRHGETAENAVEVFMDHFTRFVDQAEKVNACLRSMKSKA